MSIMVDLHDYDIERIEREIYGNTTIIGTTIPIATVCCPYGRT